MSENKPMQKSSFIFDTSPLITICAFDVNGTTVADILRQICTISMVETVTKEATANPKYSDAATIIQLITENKLFQIPVPVTDVDRQIDLYAKLGIGERDTIRAGVANKAASIILDDHLAFVIATRFGQEPILLLDFLVKLSKDQRLDQQVAIQIVQSIARRYSQPFVEHTLEKLRGLK